MQLVSAPVTGKGATFSVGGWGTRAWWLALLAALVVIFVGAMSGWLVARASGQEALQRLQGQQADEVEVVARLLASKIEQSQKLLRQVATGITPQMLHSPSSLQWLLQQGLPAVQFFDSLQVARQDGELRVNLQYGRFDNAANLEPTERDSLRRTLQEGKPMVSELIAGRTSEARVMFTQPLHRPDGSVMGVVAGGLKLQSQGLLPGSLLLPARSDSRLLVFTRDGTILLHSDPARVMGNVRDEPGLAQVYAQWRAQERPVEGRGTTQVLSGYIVSMAGMPLPQWLVARVSDAQAVLAPLPGAQRHAWWVVAGTTALSAVGVAALLLLWLVRPLAQLRTRAVQMLDRHTPPTMPWPRAGGEVGALVQVFQALQAQYAQQAVAQKTIVDEFQAVMVHASISIVILQQGMLQKVGSQACRMLGYTEEELRGRPVRELYWSDADYAQTSARVKAGFAEHGALMGDVCLRRKDGSSVWVRVQGCSVNPADAHGATVWTLEDLTTVHAAREQNIWLAAHDPLTQLTNRQGCERRLHLLLAERLARRCSETPLAGVQQGAQERAADGVFLYLDLDHFTVVNDLAGHDAGDDVLCHVAQLLQTQVGQSGWVARLSGDEFGVVLPDCAAAHGAEVAAQLCAVVRAWEPMYQGRSFVLGASIGMVVLDACTQDAASVLQAADMACYSAKRTGRNRMVLHVPQRV